MANRDEKEMMSSQSGYFSRERKPYVEMEEPLPLSYGDNKIVLLPRDPQWIYAYWEINGQKEEEVREKLGKDIFQRVPLSLRVYDVTNIEFNGLNAHHYFDIAVYSKANNWYINVDRGGKSYCVDVGLQIPGKDFFVLARSNIITLPEGKISDISDEEWMMLKGDFEKLMKLAGIEKIGKTSPEAKRKILYELEEILSVTSPGISPSGMWIKPEARGFWLMADTELTVYGATEPDSILTVQGKRIPLKSDGTFSIRFSLPDGCQEIPVEAFSRDEKEKRGMKITVTRQTDQQNPSD